MNPPANRTPPAPKPLNQPRILNHRMAGRVIKDHLLQPFLAQAESHWYKRLLRGGEGQRKNVDWVRRDTTAESLKSSVE